MTKHRHAAAEATVELSVETSVSMLSASSPQRRSARLLDLSHMATTVAAARSASRQTGTDSHTAADVTETYREAPETSKRRARRVTEAVTIATDTPATATQFRAASPDGLTRCGWSTVYTGASSEEYVRYHDHEWGVPTVSDKVLFEHLVLDGAQCGLSWSTILAKREAYTRCFKEWDIEAVSHMVRCALVLLDVLFKQWLAHP